MSYDLLFKVSTSISYKLGLCNLNFMDYTCPVVYCNMLSVFADSGDICEQAADEDKPGGGRH